MIQTREVNQNARKLEVVESFIVHITFFFCKKRNFVNKSESHDQEG